MNKKYLIAAVLIVATAIIVVWWRSDRSVTNYPPKNESIVAFGDSLVYGYGSSAGNDFVSKLSKLISRPIINLGIPGDTSAQGLARIGQVKSLDPGTVIVLLGGNDFLRKVSQEETFRNLRNIVTSLQASGSMVVLLGVRGGLITDPYDKQFRKLADETGSIFVLDVLSGLVGNPSLMSDSIHPNDAGYAIIAEKAHKALKNSLK